jgi:hypothetical protein
MVFSNDKGTSIAQKTEGGYLKNTSSYIQELPLPNS